MSIKLAPPHRLQDKLTDSTIHRTDLLDYANNKAGQWIITNVTASNYFHQ